MANAPVAGPARAWLLSPTPASRTQARCGRWFRAWLGFRRNPLAMSGLGIVLLLVLMAVFAPLIADRQGRPLPGPAGRPAAARPRGPFGAHRAGRGPVA